MARGYRNALVAAGHDVREYSTNKRFLYHARAMEGQPAMEGANGVILLSKLACENVVVEALYHHSDIVIVVSALAFHPNAVWLLREAGIPVAVLHTESPYEDMEQAEFSTFCDVTFTNEMVSADRFGWHYLRHAYDPTIHMPVIPEREKTEPLWIDGRADTCDVLILGTGWPERVALLEAIDWTGIDLRILGLWPQIAATDSPLKPYYTEVLVDNAVAPHLYASAKICLNFHRHDAEARSLNPRAYELAACGAFQLSDPRFELMATFRSEVPTFTNAWELQALLKIYLEDAAARQTMAQAARELVQPHTFEHRAAEMIEVIEDRLADRLPRPGHRGFLERRRH